jgi:threonylcarbamoyladenosine tRNA methylthiotransferase MtaB
MANVAVFTIGCKVNQAESDELKAGLAAAGHAIVCDAAKADLCVVNTCTVTAESDRKCRKLLRALQRKGTPCLVAAGCYVEIDPEGLEGLPGVIRVIPNSRKENWLQEVLSLLPEGEDRDAETVPGRERALIKVQDGCERGCSYCIVPRARGPEKSRRPAEVLESMSKHLAEGVEEVVLCGVNLGRYECGPGKDLAYLAREVLGAGEGFRVRMSSIELEDLRMEWVEEWSREPRICPHLHLPLQSGDTDILRNMGRGYGAHHFLDVVERVRGVWPRAALTTEVIVGYPGESDTAFGNTMEVLMRMRPARVHVFRFSARPGTAAWNSGAEIATGTMEERSAMLRGLADEWRLEYIDGHRGETRDLLVERVMLVDGAEVALGTTEDYIKGTAFGLPSTIRPGNTVRVEIRGVSHGRALLQAVPA